MKADMGAGAMDYRVAFDAPVVQDNGGGGQQQGWEEQFQCHARITFLRGTEAVMAARLEGRQPVVMRIRASASAAAVRTSWRIRDARSGTLFNIRAIVPSDDRAWFDVTAESGVGV